MAEQAFISSGSAPRASRLLLSPFEFFTNGEDNLRLSVCNVVAGVTIAVVGRWYDSATGTIVASRWEHVPFTNGDESTLDIALPAGVLLNLAVRALGANVVRGQCYVRIDVVRGGSAGQTLGTLIAGYTGSYAARAWPGTPLESPSDGAGWITSKQFTPAPGGEQTFFVPRGCRWRILAVRIAYLCSAVAGTREIFLELAQNGQIITTLVSPVTQAAAVGGTHIWGAGLAIHSGSLITIGQQGIPVDAQLSAGLLTDAYIHINAKNRDAGDSVTQALALVEEWRDPATVLSA